MKLPPLLITAGLLGTAHLAAQQPDPMIAVRAPVVALTHARVIDGRGHAPIENQTLILRDGRIAALTPDAAAQIPTGATVLDLTGKTVLPGLVMVHEHLYYSSIVRGPLHINEMEFSFPRLYLAAGVTSARTTGSIEPYTDLQVKDNIDAGTTPGPKLHLTAPYFDGPETGIAQLHGVKDAASAVRMVNYWADEGFTSVKVYINLPHDIMAATIDAAHKRGMQVTGHIGKVGYREAAGLGIDNLEHGFMAMSDFVPNRKEGDPSNAVYNYRSLENLDADAPAVTDLIQLLLSKHVAVTSTLAIFETFTPGRRVCSQAELDTLAPPLRESYLTRWSAINIQNNPTSKAAFAKDMKLEAKFFRAGGLLVAGTDPTGYGGCMAGYGNWRAIELLVEAGLTPVEAIQVATFNGARLLGIDASTGSIEAGKAADLIVVNGDPSKTISDIRKTEIVFKDGTGYDSKKLFDAVKGLVGIQ
ncbi:amidohydrolase family protein [Opitutus sp. GAS368]|uniref:amidohydrolase family protein n=1 Tax=Opitutus sp. GAS368 TaxID=1882749 RepID=UPI00087DBE41|nr:amidohydrolase family protein [Opitutus sp. GAS368]SDS34949.1 Amidohydrolase family protein [Opitutus sp. GAS368]